MVAKTKNHIAMGSGAEEGGGRGEEMWCRRGRRSVGCRCGDPPSPPLDTVTASIARIHAYCYASPDPSIPSRCLICLAGLLSVPVDEGYEWGEWWDGGGGCPPEAATPIVPQH